MAASVPVHATPPTTPAMSGRFRYGWIVVAVAAVAVLVGAGTRAAPGALLLGIQADTGWSVTAISWESYIDVPDEEAMDTVRTEVVWPLR